MTEKKIIKSKRGYRRVLDKVVLILTLLGVLTTVHLMIQSSRGFDRGCMGVSIAGSVEESFDCESVLMSDAGTIFGIPNAVAGFLYYVGLLLLSILLLFVNRDLLVKIKLLRSLGVFIGLIYTGYLVYFQHFVLYEYCALCLISATIVFLLVITQGVEFLKPAVEPLTISNTPRAKFETGLLGILVILTVILSVADVAYFSSLEIVSEKDIPHPAEQKTIIPAEVPVVSSDNEEKPDPSDKTRGDNCRLHPELMPVVNWQTIIGSTDPFIGNGMSDVVLVEFFDPNCKHCKTLYTTMKDVIEAYKDRVQFVYKPYPLWSYSISQVEALLIAARENRFFQMLDRQFELQKPGKGLSLEEIRDIGIEIGMDGDQLYSQLKDKRYRNLVMNQRKQAKGMGIKGAPVVMINGEFIASDSRTFDCISYFLEEALY